ncbi:MAG TPA: hypothetical protein VHV31_14100, partial [Nitrolancea sp.]|nr:hypothetical protein [Nitrolancea sp.]
LGTFRRLMLGRMTAAFCRRQSVRPIHPRTGDQDAVEVRPDDPEAPDWRYPGCYSYDRSEIAVAIARRDSLDSRSGGSSRGTSGGYWPHHGMRFGRRTS